MKPDVRTHSFSLVGLESGERYRAKPLVIAKDEKRRVLNSPLPLILPSHSYHDRFFEESCFPFSRRGTDTLRSQLKGAYSWSTLPLSIL